MYEKIETTTFSIGEKEPKRGIFSDEKIEVRRCVYCGEKAESRDIGETSNHRWEEEIIHFCSCENAMKEKEMKRELGVLEYQMFRLQNELKRLQEDGEKSLIVREKKAEYEIELIKKKYNLNEQEV